jgi:hypothetical protein
LVDQLGGVAEVETTEPHDEIGAGAAFRAALPAKPRPIVVAVEEHEAVGAAAHRTRPVLAREMSLVDPDGSANMAPLTASTIAQGNECVHAAPRDLA